MSSEKPNSMVDGDMQMVVAAAPQERPKSALPPLVPAATRSTALVEYAPVSKEEDDDLEVKLRRILEHVPVRVSNTSGSSAGSGSGDFHQYRQMRRKEQDRLTRMDVDYKKRKEEAEFNARREERLKAAEERTAKKRMKRQKKKLKKKEKKIKLNAGDGGVVEEQEHQEHHQKQESSSSEDGEDTDDAEEMFQPLVQSSKSGK